MPGESAAEDNARVRGMKVDYEMSIRGQGVGTDFGFKELADCARHPLLETIENWLDVSSEIDFAHKIGSIGQLAVSMKGRLDSISEIGKTVKRRGQSRPLNQERKKTAGSQCLFARFEPRLNIALHPDLQTKRFQNLLEPCA